ncbi:MAG: hypothetical protein U0163_07830 [Gemmatimonadaceae bacterium]
MIHEIAYGWGWRCTTRCRRILATGRSRKATPLSRSSRDLRQYQFDVLPDTPKNRQFIAYSRQVVLKYQNSGVRIEDDYIITNKGLERISMAPREISEIEAPMKTRRR